MRTTSAIGVVAAVAAIFAAPLLSAQALAAPATPVVPTVPPHPQVKLPRVVNAPTTEAPARPKTTPHAPISHAPLTTSAAKPATSAPAVTKPPAPPPSHSVVETTTGSPPAVTSIAPAATNGPSGKSEVPGTNTLHTTGPGGQSAVVTKGSTTITVPVAAHPQGVPASNEAIAAARLAPAVEVNAAQPPPVRGNFNDQVQAAIKVNVDHDVDVYRPRHWDYLDYDEYHRPSFYNPLTQDMSFRYFYDGAYQTVFVPAGGHVLLDAVVAGVFAFTAVAADFVSVGSFLGGCWVPPAGWAGPPPADWQPWQPAIYTGVPVDFANAGQTVMVEQVTAVGHDDSLPAGQQDVFMLDDSTLARGEIQPRPDGGPPQITLQQTQALPGVSPWDNGQQYINTALQKPAPSPDNRLSWILGGLAAVLALLSGVAAWVWKHPRGAHELAGASADALDPYTPTDWLSYSEVHPDTESINPGGEPSETQRAWPPTS